LQERASMLLYTRTACLVLFFFLKEERKGRLCVWRQKWYLHVYTKLNNRGSLGWHAVHNKEDLEILISFRQ
jgi:hypothetical protein